MNQSKRYCPFWNELYLFYYYYCYYSIDHDDDNVDIGDDDNNSNHSNNPNPLRFVLKKKKASIVQYKCDHKFSTVPTVPYPEGGDQQQ